MNYTDGLLVDWYYFPHTMAGRYKIDGFRIGRDGYTAFGNYYSIRIYSRALSDEEIAYTYMIDKARFGL